MSIQETQNKLFLSQLDEALNTSGAPKTEILELIKMSQAKLQCDSACEKRKNIDELRKKWMNSLKQYQTLPDDINANEKKYFDEKEGSGYYSNNILKPKYINDANENASKERKGFFNKKKQIILLLDAYNLDTIALKRLTELQNDLVLKNDFLTKEIDIHYKSTLTSERKVFYEIDEVNNLHWYHSKLMYLYFILIFLFIIFGSVFRRGNYKKISTWGYLLLYSILPFIINWLVILFYNGNLKLPNIL